MRIAPLQAAEYSGVVGPNLELLAARAKNIAAGEASLIVSPGVFLIEYNIGAAAIARLAELAGGDSAARPSRAFASSRPRRGASTAGPPVGRDDRWAPDYTADWR